MLLPTVMAIVVAGAPAPPAPVEVRAGVVAYQDAVGDPDRLRRLLSDLAAGSDPPLRLRLASGTYGDVLHWMDRGTIDLAVMTPGVLAEALGRGGDGRPLYLATVGLPPATSPLASEERRRPGRHYDYRAACVVGSASALATVADLRRAWGEGRLRFLFVHPLSVSGRVAPEFALRQAGIVPQPGEIEYSYSHSSSLRLVARPGGGEERVAFVWDDTPAPPGVAAAIRKLPFPELEALSIPPDAVAARSGYEHAGLVGRLLEAAGNAGEARDVRRLEDWAARYGAVRQWAAAVGLGGEAPEAGVVSLEEVGRILTHEARSQPSPPRLALVLSGGGAKCAFQVGAVAALEEMLAGLRRDLPGREIDIELVVGTSGGAINALPIALGLTARAEGRADLRRVWEGLDQRSLIRPSALVRWNMALWFTSIAIALVLLGTRRLAASPARRRRRVALLLAAVFAVPLLVLAYLPWEPWPLLGSSHLLHHAWLWAGFGAIPAAWCLLGLSAVLFFTRRRPRPEGREWPSWRLWALRAALAAGLLGLPLLQLLTILFHETTLTDGAGIERALADGVPRLIDAELARAGQPPLRLEGAGSDSRRLAAVSREVFARGLLRRDLVLTGSCLSRTNPGLPGDLYFHAAAAAAREPPRYGNLGIGLAAHPGILLDVVLGSGSIFPLFPARVLDDFPRAGERVELVDGGFAHNSPIEAAVLWGATHVILIEASPAAETRRGRRSFLGNSAEAFHHLYYQAQLADARSKGKAVIFTLRPAPPHICVLDFARNLLSGAVDRGYREAGGEGGAGGVPASAPLPGFQKEPGEPVFADLPAD